MKSLIVVMLILGLAGASTTNQEQDDQYSGATKTIKYVVSTFINASKDIPLDEIGEVLSNYMDTDDDLDDFIESVVKKDSFLKVVSYLKFYAKKLSPAHDLLRTMARDPAALPLLLGKMNLNVATHLLGQKYNMVAAIDKVFKSDAWKNFETLKDVTQKLFLEKEEIKTVKNYVESEKKNLQKVVDNVKERIRKHKVLSDLLNNKVQRIFVRIVTDFWTTASEYGRLKKLKDEGSNEVTAELVKEAMDKTIEATEILTLGLLRDANAVEFYRYIYSDKFKRDFKRVWDRAPDDFHGGPKIEGSQVDKDEL